MSIQDLGAIGELLGSLLVLITLIYLAVQVRHSRELLEENRKLSLSAAYQARTGFRITLAKDFAIDENWLKVQRHLRGGWKSQSVDVQIENFESLSDEEKIKLILWQETVAHSTDNALFQMELGLADENIQQIAWGTIRAQYPFWLHTGVQIPPRVQKWYASESHTRHESEENAG